MAFSQTLRTQFRAAAIMAAFALAGAAPVAGAFYAIASAQVRADPKTPETKPPEVVGVAPAEFWGYGEENGPKRWSELSPSFAICGVGSEQSPIDIRTERVPTAALPPVEILWKRFVPEMVDTGRTILVKTGGNGGVARLEGDDYQLEHIQFHHRSEHTIDGKAAEMEVQFVHRAKTGGYLILAGLITPGEANPLLDQLWPLMPDKHGSKWGDALIEPRGLLPLPASEYRYAGSLTAPPCSETVIWSVRAAPLTASEAQIAKFAAYYKNNARPVQPLGRRFVLRRD